MKDCAIKTMRVNQMKNMLCLHVSLKGNVVAAVKLGTRLSNVKSKKDSNDRSNDGVSKPLFCAYCKQTGHLKTNCFKLIRRAEGNSGGSVRTGVADVVFNSMSEGSEFTENIWIGDSGASCHYCNSD
jgi:hypothetical protein